MVSDYERGLQQFTHMVRADYIDELIRHLRALCADVTHQVVSSAGNREGGFWWKVGSALVHLGVHSTAVFSGTYLGKQLENVLGYLRRHLLAPAATPHVAARRHRLKPTPDLESPLKRAASRILVA